MGDEVLERVKAARQNKVDEPCEKEVHHYFYDRPPPNAPPAVITITAGPNGVTTSIQAPTPAEALQLFDDVNKRITVKQKIDERVI